MRKLLLFLLLMLSFCDLTAQQQRRQSQRRTTTSGQTQQRRQQSNQQRRQPSSQQRRQQSSQQRRQPTTQQRVNDLQQRRTRVQRDINQSRQQLGETQHAAVRNEQSLQFIETQLQNRLEYIDMIQYDIDSLDNIITQMDAEIQSLDSSLQVRRQQYKHSLRHAQATTSSRSPLIYMMASESFDQMYRRLRHTREYAAYQRTRGYQILSEQNLLRVKRNHLLAAKQEKSLALQEIITQRQQLAKQQTEQKHAAQQLQQQQQDIQQRITRQQAELAQLNRSIDEAIEEMERERRRQAEEAARRQAQANAQRNGNNRSGTQPSQPSQTQWLTAKDRELNGSLEQNKGRLPVPITGSYRIYRHHGINQVSQGVTLENRGVDYMGRAGAQARAIFDGEVSRVIQIGNTKHVLVRHGSYISVYSNLSSVSVRMGQEVKARQAIGAVAANEDGFYILQFQLRKETAKLNPEQWIAR
ncbi:MAG: peptidoglycan DD-metalloendopeptidase family protein [Bacteroidaceae bacterium]|nr:peptidoglycan DD-metalloendopeptidase family protein [Bacteroidaceae bacterium]